MKAAFQDSASAFPSSQLITLTKEFTNRGKFDKSRSAPFPLAHLWTESERLFVCHIGDVQILPYSDQKGHKDN